MMKRTIIIVVSLIALSYVCFMYISTPKEIEKTHYIKSILFKDVSNTLIPIYVDMNDSNSPIQMIYNKNV